MVSMKCFVLSPFAAFYFASQLSTVVSSTALNIQVSSTGGNATSPYQYGFLHEDINNSGDGGVYAELIQNRAFQFSANYPVSLDSWYPINGASLTLKNLSQPLSAALPISMNVAPGHSKGQIGFLNTGYWGMDVKVQKYTGSFWVKGSYKGVFTASLRSNLTGQTFGSVEILSKASPSQWVEHTFTLVPSRNAPNSNNTFALTFDSSGATSGSLDFNLISLFPPTYKGRANGMRQDIVDALAGFHPTIFRFPGGNMLEGETLSTYWDWKNSIGPLKDRPGFQGVWGYQQTNGVGLLEYLQFSEDMNMEMVLAVWSGMSLDGELVTEADLEPYVQDALNEIEFVRGDASTTWGAKRAALGHPEPFDLRYVEVGNEDWLAGGTDGTETYESYRFPMFLKAINAAYPDITVISSISQLTYFYDIPAPGVGDYHNWWVYLNNTPDELVSEFNVFDHETIPHLAGEMAAVHPNGGTDWSGNLMPFPWWGGAVGEAVTLIGYERNSDRVIGACYAPILRNMNRWQWADTMIQFAADPALTTRSTDWYIWELLAGHVITHNLPATAAFDPVYYVAGVNNHTGAHIFKAAVYNSTTDIAINLAFEGVKQGTAAGLTVLTGPSNPYGYNDPFNHRNVVKTTQSTVIATGSGTFHFSLPPLSVAVLDTGIGQHKRSLPKEWQA